MRRSLAAVLALCLALVPTLSGCGKKGAPMPDYSSRLFSWSNVSAVMSGDGCLSVSGAVDGSAENLADMVLELQPLDSSCEGCPFVPFLTHLVTAADAWENPSGRSFRFAYCPPLASPDAVYLWRLAGRNVFSSLPPALTPVQVTTAWGGLSLPDEASPSVEHALGADSPRREDSR